MSRELPTLWATLQSTFMPPTPRRKLEIQVAEWHLRGGHAVPAVSVSPGGAPNVQSSRTTCVASYAGVGPPYNPHCNPQLPDQTRNRTFRRRKLGALTLFLCDPCTPVGAPTSRHPWAHVEGVTGPVAYLTIPATTRNPLTTMCATSTSHHPGAHPGMLAGTWFPPHCRCTIATPTSRHHAQHVPGVTHTMGHLTIHIHAPNTPTQARKQVGGVAPWERARGSRRIQEPRWYPQRLVIQHNV